MKHVLIIAGMIVLAATSSAWAGVELRLYDGQVLRGTDVRRDGDFYILQLETGNVVSFPVPLVREVALVDDAADHDPPERLHPGLVPGKPQQLEGPAVTAPKTSEQTAVFGEPAKFSKSIIDNEWRPTSDWSNDPSQNNFAPSTWSKGVVDPNWQPKSAFDANKDVLKSSQSSFQQGVIDNSWKPTDGFKKMSYNNLGWAGVSRNLYASSRGPGNESRDAPVLAPGSRGDVIRAWSSAGGAVARYTVFVEVASAPA